MTAPSERSEALLESWVGVPVVSAQHHGTGAPRVAHRDR
jgi:hypothetical protein